MNENLEIKSIIESANCIAEEINEASTDILSCLRDLEDIKNKCYEIVRKINEISTISPDGMTDEDKHNFESLTNSLARISEDVPSEMLNDLGEKFSSIATLIEIDSNKLKEDFFPEED